MRYGLVALLIMVVGCSKTDAPRCWTCEEYNFSVDSNRALVRQETRRDIAQYCDKTEAEIQDIMHNYSYTIREVVYDKPVITQHTLQCKLQYGVQ